MMHKVLHNFGDWELETRHMSRIEKSIYFDMRTLYLKDGKPLTDDLPLLERLLMCHSDDEKQALAFLLSHKFRRDQKSHSYRNNEWDLILKNYKFRHNNAVTDTDNAVTQNDRQKAFRQRQKTLIEKLKQKGVQANSRMSYAQLTELCKTHNIAVTDDVTTDSVTNAVTTAVTDTDNDGQKFNAKNDAITINHKPLTNNHDISPQTPQRLNVAFDDFWDLYDKKQDRPKCERLWAKLKDQERLDIMAYIPNYKLSQPDKQYRKNPQTFLNNRSWENEIIFEKAVNHEPHPNSTEAYAIRLSSDIEALKRDLYPEKYA